MSTNSLPSDSLIVGQFADSRPVVRRVRSRGVTLVEVLIVVAILSMIAGGVAIFAIPKFQQAQKDTAKTDARTLQQAVETWKLTHPSASSDCPKIEDLKSDRTLKADQNTNDPWGKPYRIVCANGDFGVVSSGPDGKESTDDDISVGIAGAPGK